MASVELRTPTQRLIAFLCTAVIWLILAPIPPAFAGQVSPPPYLICNVGTDRSTPGPTSGTFTVNGKCNFPPGTHSHLKLFIYSSTDGLSDGNEATMTDGAAGQVSGTHTQAGYNAPYGSQTFDHCTAQMETPNGTLRTGSTNTSCTYQGVQTATWPTDYFSGGTNAYPPEDATPGTVACDRTLTDTSSMIGEFHSSTSGGANITSSYSWDWNWGDSSTHGTTQNGNHAYGALSTMPQDGWTAIVTWTYNAASGHAFTGGGSTATATCSLRVDFLHPENSTPSSSGGGSTGDESLDDCLPSGWNVLNPFAFIGGLGCVFKKLFIPQDESIEDLGSLWDDATSKAPFSVITDLATYLPESLLDFRQGVRCSSPTYIQPGHGAVGCGDTPSGSPETSPLCDLPLLDPCNGNAYPFAGTSLDPNDPSYSPALSVARTAFLFVMIAVFIYACWRGAGQVLG